MHGACNAPATHTLAKTLAPPLAHAVALVERLTTTSAAWGARWGTEVHEGYPCFTATACALAHGTPRAAQMLLAAKLQKIGRAWLRQVASAWRQVRLGAAHGSEQI